MGINGLWSLLTPVARPIALETLANKRLAVDASMWMYHFQMAVRDKKTGDTLQGSHIMGTFRRIVKLLYHGVRPVFVFDGDAPMLKKRTIAERKRRRAGAATNHARTAQQLLSAQLRSAAADQAMKKQKTREVKAAAKEAAEIASRVEGDVIDPTNVTYLEDLEAGLEPSAGHSRRGVAPGQARAPPPRQAHIGSSPPPEPVPSPKKKFVPRDQYALPSLDGSLQSRAKSNDTRLASEAELREIIDELRPEDFDIDSEFFSNLPVEVKYEIVGDLRIKSRQVNHRRVEQMRNAPTPLNFSRAQITNLMERNSLTQKLFDVTDTLGQASITIPTRVAGSKNKEYILVKQDVSKGGGWVLGVRNPAILSNEPIVLDNTTDESVKGVTDEEDLDEIPAVKSPAKKSSSPVPEARRHLAVEAIRARYAPPAPRTDFDPYLDIAPISTTPSGLFAARDDEDVDPSIQQALLESAQEASATIFPTFAPAQPVASTSGTSGAQANRGNGSAANIARQESRPVSVDLPSSPPAPVPASSRPPIMERQTSSGYMSIMDSFLPSDSDSDDDFEEVPVRPKPSYTRAAIPNHSIAAPAVERAIKPPMPDSPGHTPAKIAALASPQPPTPSSKPPSLPSKSYTSFIVPQSRPRRSPTPPTAFTPVQPSSALTRSPDETSNLREARASTLQPGSPSAEYEPIARDYVDVGPASPVASSSRLRLDSPLVEDGMLLANSQPSPQARSLSPVPVAETTVDVPVAETTVDGDVLSDMTAASRLDTAQMSVLDDTASTAPVPQHGGEIQPKSRDALCDEEFFEWDKSPSPPPRSPKERSLFLPDNDEFDEEQLAEFERELDGYADMVSRLNNRSLQEIREEAERDVSKLTAMRNAEQRNADGVTRQMASDIKEMLQLFGIPYVDAPSEAEAECAELLTKTLVDGIITDDSDVFLFGGARVFRHMFNDKKYVECYLMADLERELGLDRDKLVNLAYLLGGEIGRAHV